MLKIHILKNIFLQYKPFFTFLSKFLLFYVVFTFGYKMYLDQYDIAKNEVDFFTKVVANQTGKLLGFFVGQEMKKSQGKANPKILNDILKERLSKKN